MIPFSPPRIDQKIIDAVTDTLKSGWITTGPKVAAFEQALADYIGGDIQVRVFNSATSALSGAVAASGAGAADEVITAMRKSVKRRLI